MSTTAEKINEKNEAEDAKTAPNSFAITTGSATSAKLIPNTVMEDNWVVIQLSPNSPLIREDGPNLVDAAPTNIADEPTMRFSALEEENKRKSEKINELKASLKNAVSRTLLQEKELREQRKKLGDAQVYASKTAVTLSQTRTEKNEESVRRTKAEIEEMEHRFKMLAQKEEIEKLNAKISELREKVSKLDSENFDLIVEKAQLISQRSELESLMKEPFVISLAGVVTKPPILYSATTNGSVGSSASANSSSAAPITTQAIEKENASLYAAPMSGTATAASSAATPASPSTVAATHSSTSPAI